MESVNHTTVVIRRRRDYIPILMSTIRELLLKRQEEIEAQMSPLFEETTRLRRSLVETEGKLVDLRNELKQIETALRAVDDEAAKKRPPTIMEAVVEVLKAKPGGMTAREILKELNEKYFDGKI